MNTLVRLFALAMFLMLSFGLCAPAHAAPDCSVYTGAQLMQWPDANPVWEFCWRRAVNSQPQPDGSGLELFDVQYNGHQVFDRTHVPILNVEYGPGGCGCFRDWLDADRQFEAVGSPCTNGFCQATAEPRTVCTCAPDDSCDTNPNNACNVDLGSFAGVAAYTTLDTLELTTQTSAGWYRYTMKWKFHLNGTIEPGFGFGATPNGCTDASHFHHGYYRFDFDIDGPANDQMFTEAVRASGTDSDGDGVDNAFDNCQFAANADQIDADDDGFGNVCDADLNNDNVTNVTDLGLLRAAFFSADAVADFNSDGIVNVVDLAVLRTLFFAPPGPAGNAAARNRIDAEQVAYSDNIAAWSVTDTVTGRGYRLYPGRNDQDLTADTFDPVPFAAGDYWVLAEKANEIDDGINYGSGCSAQLDAFVGGDSVVDTDIVFWYRFGTHHVGLDECYCGEIGPRLVPIGDWSADSSP